MRTLSTDTIDSLTMVEGSVLVTTIDGKSEMVD